MREVLVGEEELKRVMENNIIPTVGVLIIKNKQVLLVRHREGSEHLSGKYGLPSGRIQNGEGIKEEALRKLKEETGLDVDLDSLILLPNEWQASIERKGGSNQYFSLKVFLAVKFNGELTTGQNETPEWINLEEIETCDLLPNVEKVIREGLNFLPIKK